MRNRKSIVALAALAGGLVPLSAMAQSMPQPTLTPAGAKVMPLRMAKAMKINGKVVQAGPWLQAGATQPEGVLAPAFDCFEADSLGAPTGFCDSCAGHNAAQCPPAGAGSRWSYPESNTAWSVNDMTVAPGFEGSQSTRVEFGWGWGPVSGQCFIAVFTAEDFSPCGSTEPTSGGFPNGVIFDFGVIVGGPGSAYHYTDATLASGLFLQMPMDGTGAYEMFIGNANVGGVLTLDTTPGTRPMLWGCGQDESPADPRVGTQGDLQWDDAGPLAPAGTFATGTMESATECLSYNFGVGAFCPFRLGTMMLFYAEPGTTGPTCYANCDGSTTNPFLNVLDFNCFLNAFNVAQGLPPDQQLTHYANCDGSTTPPVLNVLDFNCFLNAFNASCTAP